MVSYKALNTIILSGFLHVPVISGKVHRKGKGYDGNIRYSNSGKPSEAFREAALADSLESTPCHLDVSRGKWHRRTTGSLPDTIARKSSDTAYKQKSSDIMAR